MVEPDRFLHPYTPYFKLLEHRSDQIVLFKKTVHVVDLIRASAIFIFRFLPSVYVCTYIYNSSRFGIKYQVPENIAKNFERP